MTGHSLQSRLECLNYLILICRWMLETTGSETQVVITIKINRRSPEIVFKKWIQNRTTRSSHNTIRARYSNNAIEATGDNDMIIPFEKIAGRKPENAEHDIVITHADVEYIYQNWYG
ncbi:hypothetical protein H109_07939 [Trichophyton interdigitale MR816]|uniref:Uncharacterized protein n=1 Tax=Trichophyton interdigitale (strain MR816) TaxID=1215338 RepID=A0A059IXZ7_TRIIM|nr:hypothetical protein H101_08055 [Trichophyton interdigitale H6]KDB20102.1 hypothetical protein H109_07939 [Trichophyton interdigitale MR816]